MSEKLSKNQEADIKRLEDKDIDDIIIEFLKGLIERIRGKSIKKQLEFLLNPEIIETSSRLTKNEIMAVTQADFLGDNYDCFKPLKTFWRSYAKWKISEAGKGRDEAIKFTQASREPKIVSVTSPFQFGKKKEESE